MTTLEKLQEESRERRRLMAELKRLTKLKSKLEERAKLFVEEVPEPEDIEPTPVKKVRKPPQPTVDKFIVPKPLPKIDLDKVKEFNKKTTPAPVEPPIDVEKIREFVNARKADVNRVYENAFTDPRDMTRPPAKYSNRKAIDDYDV